jgi:hypothetical protein
MGACRGVRASYDEISLSGDRELDANEEILIAFLSQQGITWALTTLRKERLNMRRPINQRFPAFCHNYGEAACSVAAIGADAAWTVTGNGRVC